MISSLYFFTAAGAFEEGGLLTPPLSVPAIWDATRLANIWLDVNVLPPAFPFAEAGFEAADIVFGAAAVDFAAEGAGFGGTVAAFGVDEAAFGFDGTGLEGASGAGLEAAGGAAVVAFLGGGTPVIRFLAGGAAICFLGTGAVTCFLEVAFVFDVVVPKLNGTLLLILPPKPSGLAAVPTRGPGAFV